MENPDCQSTCVYDVVQDDCSMQIIEFERALQTGQNIAMHAHHPDR